MEEYVCISHSNGILTCERGEYVESKSRDFLSAWMGDYMKKLVASIHILFSWLSVILTIVEPHGRHQHLFCVGVVSIATSKFQLSYFIGEIPPRLGRLHLFYLVPVLLPLTSLSRTASTSQLLLLVACSGSEIVSGTSQKRSR